MPLLSCSYGIDYGTEIHNNSAYVCRLAHVFDGQKYITLLKRTA